MSRKGISFLRDLQDILWDMPFGVIRDYKSAYFTPPGQQERQHMPERGQHEELQFSTRLS
jgi:hypothetical protein